MRIETLNDYAFWGKLHPKNEHRDSWHPLIDHCVDVASVARALLELPTWCRRLHRLGLPCEDDAARDTVAIVVGLHDLGKLSPGFQKARAGIRPDSHVQAAMTLLSGSREAHPTVTDMRVCLAEALPPDRWHWLIASVCHHGRPGTAGDALGPTWAPHQHLSPLRELTALLDTLRSAFPRASWPLALPTVQRRSVGADHALCGLVVLSDWIGSNTHWFPFRKSLDEDRITLARTAARTATSALQLQPPRNNSDPSFESVFPGLTARGLQTTVAELSMPTGPSVTLFEAATGSGKTEAALHWFARLHAAGAVDGLYFALPMRTAAVQLHERVSAAGRQLWGDQSPGTVLAVPSYYQVDRWKGEHLGGYEVQWEPGPDRGQVWAAESPKQYLAATVAVGTIDQVLLGALQTKWTHFRGTCVLRQLLVVDEVHASDTYMARLLLEIVRRQVNAGGHVLLLSATLGARLRTEVLRVLAPRAHRKPQALTEAREIPYPCAWTSDGRTEVLHPCSSTRDSKVVAIEPQPVDDPTSWMCTAALDAGLAGARVLVIRNTVRDAVALHRALDAVCPAGLLLHIDGVSAPHHSRFAGEDRRMLDRALLDRLGKAPSRSERKPVIAVTTQTAEQSLDLDADLLITDLCPMDVLLQRIGRLHRHEAHRATGYESARCVVVLPTGPLTAHQRGQGLGSVYQDLPVLEATRRLVEGRTPWTLPDDNRELVELATHPEVLHAIASESEGMTEASLEQQGRELAASGTARNAICDWSGPFLRTFPRPAPPTRLGDDSVRVPVHPPVPSPFSDASYDRLDIPRRLLGAASEPRLTRVGDVLTEHETGATFTYSRHGLERTSTSQRQLGEETA